MSRPWDMGFPAPPKPEETTLVLRDRSRHPRSFILKITHERSHPSALVLRRTLPRRRLRHPRRRGPHRRPTDVEAFRLHWLGRKQGRLKLISEAWLKSAPPEAKKALGIRFNQLKQQIEQALEAPATPRQSAEQGIDITLPGSIRSAGHPSPAPRNHARGRPCLPSSRLQHQPRPPGRVRLLQLRSPQLPPQPPRPRHPGHPPDRRPAIPPRHATASSCAPTPARSRSAP